MTRFHQLVVWSTSTSQCGLYLAWGGKEEKLKIICAVLMFHACAAPILTFLLTIAFWLRNTFVMV